MSLLKAAWDKLTLSSDADDAGTLIENRTHRCEFTQEEMDAAPAVELEDDDE